MIELPWQENERGFVLSSRYLEAQLERLPSSTPEGERYQARIVTPDGRRWESEVGLNFGSAEAWVEEQLRESEILDYHLLSRDMVSLLFPLLNDRHPLYQAWLMMIVGPVYDREARSITSVDVTFDWRQSERRSEADIPLGRAVIVEQRRQRSAYSFGRSITYHPALLDPSGAELVGPTFTEWEDAERWLYGIVNQFVQAEQSREGADVAYFLFDICHRLIPVDTDPILAQCVEELYQWVEPWVN